MTRGMFIAPVAAFAALTLAGCVSRSPEADPARLAESEAEVKRLENQAAEIVAVVKDKGPGTPDADRILAGDEVTIQVWKRDKTTQFPGFPLVRNVPDSGEMFVPGIGLTGVGGKTDGELQAALQEHFGKILVEPTIIVRHKGTAPAEQDVKPLAIIVSHQAKVSAGGDRARTGRRVALMGWTIRQGLYSLDESLTLRDLLAKAGGFEEYANQRHVYVVRGSLQNPDILIINMARILVGKDLEKNVALQPNDAVYVPPVGLWQVYDVIRKILLPIRAVRETIWETTAPVNP